MREPENEGGLAKTMRMAPFRQADRHDRARERRTGFTDQSLAGVPIPRREC